jgi:hypothetical protein
VHHDVDAGSFELPAVRLALVTQRVELGRRPRGQQARE